MSMPCESAHIFWFDLLGNLTPDLPPSGILTAKLRSFLIDLPPELNLNGLCGSDHTYLFRSPEGEAVDTSIPFRGRTEEFVGFSFFKMDTLKNLFQFS